MQLGVQKHQLQHVPLGSLEHPRLLPRILGYSRDVGRCCQLIPYMTVRSNLRFINDFANLVGPWSLKHFETAKGTLAPSPIARVIGCGCAESRTSPAVGPCCSYLKIIWDLVSCISRQQNLWRVRTQKESLIFILDPSTSSWRCPEDHWTSLLQWWTPCNGDKPELLILCKIPAHIHFKAIVIEAVFCKVNIHQPIFAQFNKEVHGKQDIARSNIHSQDPPQPKTSKMCSPSVSLAAIFAKEKHGMPPPLCSSERLQKSPDGSERHLKVWNCLGKTPTKSPGNYGAISMVCSLIRGQEPIHVRQASSMNSRWADIKPRIARTFNWLIQSHFNN